MTLGDCVVAIIGYHAKKKQRDTGCTATTAAIIILRQQWCDVPNISVRDNTRNESGVGVCVLNFFSPESHDELGKVVLGSAIS